MDAGGAVLAEGRRALDDARWVEARACFEAVLGRAAEAGPGLDARDVAGAQEGLGLALWFLGEVPAAVAAREHAHERYVAAGDADGAARCAVWVAHQQLVGHRTSAARGWLARAERALDGVPECAGHGWVALERARQAPAGVAQARCAEAAVVTARRTGAVDLEVLALSLLGRAEVAAGRGDRGVALLEEAMVAATSDRVRDGHTLAEAYCNLVVACADAGDWQRATEWCRLVEEHAQDRGAAPLLGACRAVHADVLLSTGQWVRAEAALQDALAIHARAVPEPGGPAAASLAELRVLQGRLEEAEALLAPRSETPSGLRALALLRSAQGRADEAVVLLRRGLRACEGDALRVVGLSASLVDALLDAGDPAGAEQAGAALAGRASRGGLPLAVARSDLASARVALATGRAAGAVDAARRALAGFLLLAMPVDAALARLELARALAVSAPSVATDEAQVARAVLDAVGAVRGREAADRLMATLAALHDGDPHDRGGADALGLTAREEEVLALVARGLSNAAVADALVITEKTAGHHVSHILAKLGVRNRTEAAARLADVRESKDRRSARGG